MAERVLITYACLWEIEVDNRRKLFRNGRLVYTSMQTQFAQKVGHGTNEILMNCLDQVKLLIKAKFNCRD